MKNDKDALELERIQLALDRERFELERDRANLKMEERFFKKDLVEVARRNIEVILGLSRINAYKEPIYTNTEIREMVRPYLAVLENTITLNK